MQTSILDKILWSLVYVAGSVALAFVVLGWLKGMYWENQLKLKKRHSHR